MSKRMMAIALAVVLLVSALSGCGKKETAAPVNGEELYEKMAALDLFPEMIRRDEQMVSDYYGIEPDKCVQLVNYVTADGLMAEEFLLVETKEEAYAATVEQLLSEELARQGETYRDYMPEEYEKIAAARLERRGAYVLLIVSNDADALYAVFSDGAK